MEPQAAQVDVVAVAVGAFVRPLAGVQALVELEVDELGELCRAEFAVVGLLPRVKAQVGFQVAGAAETFVANLEETKAEGDHRRRSLAGAARGSPGVIPGIRAASRPCAPGSASAGEPAG